MITWIVYCERSRYFLTYIQAVLTGVSGNDEYLR